MYLLPNIKSSIDYGDEQIFVVPYAICNTIPDYFTVANNQNIYEFFYKIINYGFFVERGKAEKNYILQQIIPYVILINNKNEFLVSKRIGGDKRLLDKLSLGFGGHINPCDISNINKLETISNNIIRELTEATTLNLKGIKNEPKFVGFVRNINSDLSDHLGLVYILNVKNRRPIIKETNKSESIWMNRGEMVRLIEKFDMWSQFIIASNILENAKKEW